MYFLRCGKNVWYKIDFNGELSKWIGGGEF